MDSALIGIIQKRVEELLLAASCDLCAAAKDQCSEVARLVGCWVLKEYPGYSAHIFKGEFADGSAHDIVGISGCSSIALIDPTIWQLFPASTGIHIGSAGDASEAVAMLASKYGGTWKISETIKQYDFAYQQELLDIIKRNGSNGGKPYEALTYTRIICRDCEK